jgi:polar amino acid transport system substrate-binding protein
MLAVNDWLKVMIGMRLRSPSRLFHALAALMALAVPWIAHAHCSRPLAVPVAPLGLSVITADGAVRGVYPEFLLGLAKDGCSIAFSVVPRARQEAMFEAGLADLLVPATRTPRRDLLGHFVPTTLSRPLLISIGRERLGLRSLNELVERPELRVAVVRGFDYGPAYQALLQQLGQQRRLIQEVDPISVARALAAGMADLTIMTPTILVGALHGDKRLGHLLDRLRFEPMDELPLAATGIYITNKPTLSEADRTRIRELLESGAKSDAVWRAYQRHYSPDVLADSIRPL